MKKLSLIFRLLRRLFRMVKAFIDAIHLKLMLFINNVDYQSIHSNGLPYFCVGLNGICKIGKNFGMNNGLRFNPIGYPQPCIVYVKDGAKLVIGDNVGISQAAIICHKEIEIQDNVKLGGGG